MNVKSMTAKQLANMTLEEFNSLNLKQAQDALTILNRAVNKSMRRAEKAGEVATKAPAYKNIQKGGGALKTRGYEGSSGLNMAKAEIKRAMDYLNASTRTVKGAKAHFSRAAKYYGVDEEQTTIDELRELRHDIDMILEEFPAEYSKTYEQVSPPVLYIKVAERLKKGNSAKDIRDALVNQYETLKEQNITFVTTMQDNVWTKFDSELNEKLK